MMKKLINNAIGLIIGIVVCTILTLLFGCKSIEYVPIEVTKTVTVHETDTVETKVENNTHTNTIIREGRPEDSVLLAKLGIKLAANERLLILQQEQISNLTNELKEIHNKDSVRVDSVQVPVPVERKLSKWESFCIDYGKIMAGATAAAIIEIGIVLVLWIKKRHRCV